MDSLQDVDSVGCSCAPERRSREKMRLPDTVVKPTFRIALAYAGDCEWITQIGSYALLAINLISTIDSGLPVTHYPELEF